MRFRLVLLLSLLAVVVLAACAGLIAYQGGEGETVAAPIGPPATPQAEAQVSGPAAPAAAPGGGFSDWAAIVVSGDYKAGNGAPIEAFDNARRDVIKTLGGLGFAGANIKEFSVSPNAGKVGQPPFATPEAIDRGLFQLRANTRPGCLLYFTSHGSPKAMVLGKGFMTPEVLWHIVNVNCGQRPTIVVVSACFSGIFETPESDTDNRMLLTAASKDRTSFGCGANFKYPYFDQCFIESAEFTHNFIDLADRTRGCISVLELKNKVQASQPQLRVGAKIGEMLKTIRFGSANSVPAAEPVGQFDWK